jgi:uncharacterized OsmC-like protein
VAGRALNSVGVHHFVIDGTSAPREEITPVDAFLAGISACGVHMLERFAPELNVGLERAEATIEGVRRADDPARFQEVRLHFRVVGPGQQQAEELVELFKAR